MLWPRMVAAVVYAAVAEWATLLQVQKQIRHKGSQSRHLQYPWTGIRNNKGGKAVSHPMLRVYMHIRALR